MKLTLPKWYDLHVHVRQGAALQAYVKAQLSMGCAGILAMPNTKPPVGKVLEEDDLPYWSIEGYLKTVKEAADGQLQDVIVPLYLTKDTTPAMIEAGAKSGLLRAAKYYPPHGTTNADHGRPLQSYIDNGVFAAMEKAGIVLCVHGEEHGLSGESYFGRDSNAEDYFYRERLPRVRDQFPDLKIVCEHITTKTAVEFIQNAGDKTGATITPQHLLYSVGDLLQGCRYHLYCLPLVKFEEDRLALVEAVNDSKNTRIFAGTDSAPHAQKQTPCGCAAGCYTGGIAPQLYAQAFDLTKGQDAFESFLCHNGQRFYGLPKANGTFTLIQHEAKLEELVTEDGAVTPLPLGLNQATLPWTIEL
jgi:dihydroorotase